MLAIIPCKNSYPRSNFRWWFHRIF